MDEGKIQQQNLNEIMKLGFAAPIRAATSLSTTNMKERPMSAFAENEFAF